MESVHGFAGKALGYQSNQWKGCKLESWEDTGQLLAETDGGGKEEFNFRGHGTLSLYWPPRYPPFICWKRCGNGGTLLRCSSENQLLFQDESPEITRVTRDIFNSSLFRMLLVNSWWNSRNNTKTFFKETSEKNPACVSTILVVQEAGQKKKKKKEREKKRNKLTGFPTEA